MGIDGIGGFFSEFLDQILGFFLSLLPPDIAEFIGGLFGSILGGQ